MNETRHSTQPLAARLVVDQRERWQRGEQILVEAYLEQHPALLVDLEGILDLIYHEMLLREQAGDAPQPDEYLARFPELADQLRLQFEVDQALQSGYLCNLSSDKGGDATVRGAPVITPGKSGANRPVLAGYEVDEVLGRGGMGIVYRARQLSLNRVVALKMVLSGAHAGPEELARFRIEAEAAACLQHPNIVQIYEVGEQDGFPFCSLEFVDNGSLAQKLNGTPQSARPAAQLIETLARAMHCAHQRGIVHRDLKPANILLTANDTPKITDFGLAKRLDGDAGQTQSGTILGTPSYMAPEQARGTSREIGPAVDIYALGAVLYEVLTGRPPFRAPTLAETLLQVQTQEPVPPRRLQPRVPRDLETICLKCLEKETQRRYASAEALADDLRRFLAGQSIQARPVGIVEWTFKWSRRRPAAACLIGVILLAVLTLSLGGWCAYAALRASEKREEQQRLQAEVNFQQALDAVEQLLSEVGEVDLAEVPQMEPVRERLLRKALGFYQKLSLERQTDPALRQDVGRANSRLGDILAMLGEHAEAEKAYGQAITLLQALAIESPGEANCRRCLARSYNNLGILLKKNTRFQEAENAFDQALRLRQELADQFRTDPESQRELEVSRYQRATLLARLGERDQEAEAAYRLVLARQEQLANEFRDRPDYQGELGRTCNNLGILLDATDRKGAEKAFRDAVCIHKELSTRFPAVPGYREQLARSYSNLGNLLKKNHGTIREAEEAYRESLSLLMKLADDFPRVPDYQQELAALHDNLGMLCADTGRPDEAERAFHSALALRDKLAADFPGVPDYRLKLALVHRNVGDLLANTGRPGEAETAYRRAVAIQEGLVADYKEVPDYESALGCILNHLARLLLKRGEQAEVAQALEIIGGSSGNLLICLCTLLPARVNMGEARSCLNDAIRHQQTALKANPRNPSYLDFLRNDYVALAVTLVRDGDHAGTAALVEEFPKLFPERPEEYLRAAQFLTLCIPLAEKDNGLPEEQRQHLAQNYGGRAVELLRAAADKGFRHVEELKQLPAYDPLRQRPDFRKLLLDLDQKEK